MDPGSHYRRELWLWRSPAAVHRSIQDAGLFARPYTRSVMGTSLKHQNRYLALASFTGPQARIHYGADQFKEFYPSLRSGRYVRSWTQERRSWTKQASLTSARQSRAAWPLPTEALTRSTTRWKAASKRSRHRSANRARACGFLVGPAPPDTVSWRSQRRAAIGGRPCKLRPATGASVAVTGWIGLTSVGIVVRVGGAKACWEGRHRPGRDH